MTTTPHHHLVRAAFPAACADAADVVATVVFGAEQLLPSTLPPVGVLGEHVRLPARVYGAEPLDLLSLGARERLVAACWYTRHADGMVRERNLRHVLRSPVEAWSVPFVVALMGEYVVEILDVIAAHIDVLRTDAYRAFFEANPASLRLLEARSISYWSAYRRRKTPRFADDVAFRLLEGTGALAPSHLARLRRLA